MKKAVLFIVMLAVFSSCTELNQDDTILKEEKEQVDPTKVKPPKKG